MDLSAKELRIENLILVDWNNEIKGFDEYSPDFKETQVSEIHRKYIQDNHGEGYSFKEDIKPIPLTEDWLFKCGFVIDPDFYHSQVKLWQSNSGFNYLTLNKNDYGYESCLGFSPPQDENIRILIDECLKYVHQLQNLFFALTSQELEIKEFA